MNVPLLRRHWSALTLIVSKAVYTALIGFFLAFAPDSAFQSVAWYRLLNHPLSRQALGALYVVIPALLITALIRRRDRDLVPALLGLEAMLYVYLAVSFVGTALTHRLMGGLGALIWFEVASSHILIAVRLQARDA